MINSKLKTNNAWRFWVDRGGTFTDIVFQNPTGKINSYKLLSSAPKTYRDSVIEGISRILESNPSKNTHIAEIHIGTTVATNALLEGKGEPTLLCITEGFRDALEIGDQTRQNIFERIIIKPKMIYKEVIEIQERLNAKGKVLRKLNINNSKRKLIEAYKKGLTSIAIVLMHGYKHSRHEKILENIAKDIGFKQVSVSYKISPLIKLINRANTTVADAYLSPIVNRYINNLQSKINTDSLLLMQSSGRLAKPNNFKGKDAILSGPAGGVIAGISTASDEGFSKVIGFDMGGTSTDVWHYNGEQERTIDSLIAGYKINTPMLKIHTVAAGGGSKLNLYSGRFTVGPESAAANPGPACYRNNGPLTLTDCNLILGRISKKSFPKLFGNKGNLTIDDKNPKKLFKQLLQILNKETGKNSTIENIAEGFLAIAIENMSNAIKKISTQKGHDVTNYVLTCFGSAAGQHACRVAEKLGMSKVLIHPLASVLSAYGMGLADIGIIKQKSLEQKLTKLSKKNTNKIFNDLSNEAKKELKDESINKKYRIPKIFRRFHLRYSETDSTIVVNYSEKIDQIIKTFEKKHMDYYGYLQKKKPIIVELVELELIHTSKNNVRKGNNQHHNLAAKPAGTTQLYVNGSWKKVPFFYRKKLKIKNSILGPALIFESNSTTVVEAGWSLKVTESKSFLISKSKEKNPDLKINTSAPNPILLEIFNNSFMSIAEQMGVVLQKTAHSVNIKERLDFSCALFDKEGSLIANAPHIPIHLGAMSESVKAVIDAKKHFKPLDSFIHNAPYRGGTHLPDITVITPVFIKNTSLPEFFVASRAHHADIGGITPGSMPANSNHIDQEGAMFDCEELVKNGKLLEKNITKIFLKNPHPARNLSQNLSDISAQLAASHAGIRELKKLVKEKGINTVLNYMEHVKENAKKAVEDIILKLKDGHFHLLLDNGSYINVKIIVNKIKPELIIDFTKSSPQLSDNFNAPFSVCQSAVLYVLRTLVNQSIPLNDGCLESVKIVIPKGSMLNPEFPAAVVAGNVETSQSIVDAINGALEIQAACYGTMSNLTFGNNKFGYYETICGGAGAGFGFNGADSIHCHMTNTRLTDPEILELRFPVTLESFKIRKKSGGQGKWHGGNGTIRKLRFEKTITAVILSNRRKVAPFGLNGGKSGKKGINKIIRSDGTIEKLKYADKRIMKKGDVLEIHTPGGGGYGKKYI